MKAGSKKRNANTLPWLLICLVHFGPTSVGIRINIFWLQDASSGGHDDRDYPGSWQTAGNSGQKLTVRYCTLLILEKKPKLDKDDKSAKFWSRKCTIMLPEKIREILNIFWRVTVETDSHGIERKITLILINYFWN